MTSRLVADQLALAYGEELVISPLSVEIPDGAITTIIGPNGCGKSTLLRGLARLRPAQSGAVLLDGQEIHQWSTIDVARRLGLLGQQPSAPEAITVEELVHRGRYPHQSFFQPPSPRDTAAVERALDLAGVQPLRRRMVDQLSGGQRQRAWIAMALAQETPLLLLDEPTTYLDLAHQMEVMDLVKRLNTEEDRTVVMVLHDVNEAARVSDYIIAMRAGKIVREGFPSEILNADLLTELYDVPCDVYQDERSGRPFYVPRSGVWNGVRDDRGPAAAFEIAGVSAGYSGTDVVRDLSLTIPAGQITAIIGPNASGKSTLLRTCCRLLQPRSGVVRLDGQDVRAGSHKALARRLGLLLQGARVPEGFVVEDLVAAGRVPHQGLFKRRRSKDDAAIETALDRCDLCELRHRPVETLSGGQQRRCWFGMALAQETPALLLDEPTTFLDPAAQITLLDIVRSLNRDLSRTVVMVLHDLNLAARYADNLVVMKDGQIVASGPPREVMTSAMLRDVFAVEAEVFLDPVTEAPLCFPYAHRHETTGQGTSDSETFNSDRFMPLGIPDRFGAVGAEVVSAH